MSGRRDIVLGKPELELKVATRALIAAAGGTDGAGETCRARQQRMSDCQNRCTADFLRIDEVAALEDVTSGPDWPQVTRALAQRQGFVLLQLPSPGAPQTVFSALIGRLAKEGGELMAGVCQDLSDDNDVSPEEARRRLPDADDLVRVVVELRAALRARAEGGPSQVGPRAGVDSG